MYIRTCQGDEQALPIQVIKKLNCFLPSKVL
nr:MAG TPA: protein of unknown function (DUF2095) [Caudoviricetes sp.]